MRIWFYALCLLVIISFVMMPVEAKKKKKVKKAKKGTRKVNHAKPEKSSPKRPDGTTPELYCNACQAIVKEALKKLKHRKSEAEVFDVLDDVCNPKHYYIYMFPPPEMKQGCEAFIMDWEEQLEKTLLNRETNAEVEKKICYEISEACTGVDVEKDTPRMPEEVWVDG